MANSSGTETVAISPALPRAPIQVLTDWPALSTPARSETKKAAVNRGFFKNSLKICKIGDMAGYIRARDAPAGINEFLSSRAFAGHAGNAHLNLFIAWRYVEKSARGPSDLYVLPCHRYRFVLCLEFDGKSVKVGCLPDEP